MRYIARIVGLFIERQGERLWNWGAKKMIENFYRDGVPQKSKHVYNWDKPSGEQPW